LREEGAMSSLKSDEDPDELLQRAARMVVDGNQEIRAVARSLGVNEKHLDDAVWYLKENRQHEADELLQRAARMVVDGNQEIRAVARSLGVNEKHLDDAVWYLKQNRDRDNYWMGIWPDTYVS
jgi:transposase-like protein